MHRKRDKIHHWSTVDLQPVIIDVINTYDNYFL